MFTNAEKNSHLKNKSGFMPNTENENYFIAVKQEDVDLCSSFEYYTYLQIRKPFSPC